MHLSLLFLLEIFLMFDVVYVYVVSTPTKKRRILTFHWSTKICRGSSNPDLHRLDENWFLFLFLLVKCYCFLPSLSLKLFSLFTIKSLEFPTREKGWPLGIIKWVACPCGHRTKHGCDTARAWLKLRAQINKFWGFMIIFILWNFTAFPAMWANEYF